MPKKQTPKTIKAIRPKSSNVEPKLKNLSVSARYEECFNILFDKLTPEHKKRVLDAKTSSKNGEYFRDVVVQEFVESVIKLADSYESS